MLGSTPIRLAVLKTNGIGGGWVSPRPIVQIALSGVLGSLGWYPEGYNFVPLVRGTTLYLLALYHLRGNFVPQGTFIALQ